MSLDPQQRFISQFMQNAEYFIICSCCIFYPKLIVLNPFKVEICNRLTQVTWTPDEFWMSDDTCQYEKLLYENKTKILLQWSNNVSARYAKLQLLIRDYNILNNKRCFEVAFTWYKINFAGRNFHTFKLDFWRYVFIKLILSHAQQTSINYS